MLTIKHLVKVYSPAVRAIDDVSLTLERGVVGLIGHNGAGKTTLIDMLCTLTRPTSGHILLDAVDVVAKPRPCAVGWASCRRTLGPRRR
jgi:ABC-2 type transport system ATP-binding protein